MSHIGVMTSNDGPDTVDTVIIGSGFSGLGMAIRLQRSGRTDFVILERAVDLGGTWRDNTYPGCQCDVPSHLYSYSFAPNPGWGRTYSPQPEIWSYLQRCADEFGIRSRIRLNEEVRTAAWNEARQRWEIETSKRRYLARVLISAAGALSEPSIPPLPGLDTFPGTWFHSARWNHDHDLSCRRVAVVGTGASAIQFVPKIQPQVEQLVLFQRTPAWILPHTDRPLTRFEHNLYRRLPRIQQLVREAIYWSREGFVPVFVNRRLNPLPAQIARRHLERQVKDRKLRAALTPNYAVGCKRILLSNEFYPAITQANVELVTSGLARIEGSAAVAGDGDRHDVDTIIFATGFHVADMPIAGRICGRDGQSLADRYNGSPHAHRGTTVPGFPNLFLLLGPNTALGHTSVMVMAEAQMSYVIDCLESMDRHRLGCVEVRPDAEAAYNRDIDAAMENTVWTAGGCSSWYLDSRGRNSALWPRFTWQFVRSMRRFDLAHYQVQPDTVAP